MTSNGLLTVKVGGGAGLDLEAVCDDLALLSAERPLLIVHGVSHTMNRLCAEQGIEVQMLTSPGGHSSRYTPPALRDVYVQAAETENAQLVDGLRSRGLTATGFVGKKVAIRAERKQAIRAVMNGRMRMVRDDHSGRIRGVDTQPLLDALLTGIVPVLPPMAESADGLLNVDGDRAGAAVAGALQAQTYLILSNVRGLYRNFPDESSFVALVTEPQLDEALNWAQGRMKRKVLAAQEALDAGVPTVIIGDGRATNPLAQALAGEGTRFRK
ncbi:MAG: [LysW]-aminoadipate kinase [Chloroflexi bacterium]|nr:[LysW]-aminoadipate kinase [Chloroflexota bacterium]